MFFLTFQRLTIYLRCVSVCMTGPLFSVHAISDAGKSTTTTLTPKTSSYSDDKSTFGQLSYVSTGASQQTTTYRQSALTYSPETAMSKTTTHDVSNGPPTTDSHDTTAPRGPSTVRPSTFSLLTKGKQDTTTPYGDPLFRPSTIGQHNTTAPYGPPTFSPPLDTSVPHGLPTFGPPTFGPHDTSAPHGPPTFGPLTFGPPTFGPHDTSAPHGPPTFGPLTFGPPTFGPHDTSAPHGPSPFGPPTSGPHNTPASYGPPPFGPPTSGPHNTPASYGPPTFGPPTVGPSDTTTPYGPPTFGSPSNGAYGPSSFGPPASGRPPSGYVIPAFNQPSDNESINTRTTTEHTTDSSSPWISNPILFTENFDLISYIKTICPDTKSCQGNVTGSSHQAPNCCVQCDCSDDCFAKGTCCYDKEIPVYLIEDTRLTTSLKESCVFPTYGLSDAQLLRSFNKKSMLMINNCVIDEEVLLEDLETQIYTCKNLSVFNVSSILDIVPVYSPEMGVSFSNHICAKCNAANQSLIPWLQSTLSCPRLESFSDLFSLSTGIDSFLHILEASDCILEFHPPHNNSVECLHEQSVISDCDEEAMEHINPKIREYCRNVSFPFGTETKMYKNIFCFGCNERVFDHDINDFSCYGNSQGYGYDYGNPEAEIGLSSLERLLVESLNESDEMTGTICEDGFIYHQYLSQCIAYTCAPSKVNISGQCIPVLKKMKNIALDYIVKYRFLVGTADSNKYSYLAATTNMVHGDFYVELCRQDIDATASLKDFYVTFDISVSRTITEMTDIEETFDFFKQRYNASVNAWEKGEISLGHEGYETMKFGQFGFVQYKGLADEMMCPESVAMVDLQFCDAVAVLINKNQTHSDGDLWVNSMKFKRSEYLLLLKTTDDSDLMYVQICRDLFESRLETLIEKNNGNGYSNEVNGIEVHCSSLLLTGISILLWLYTLFN